MIQFFDAILTGCKLNVLTKESFKKITKLTNKEMDYLVKENYFSNEKYYTKDEKIECIKITDKGIDFAKKEIGFKKIYYSNSITHDVAHSKVVADKIEEFGVTIREYKSEKELPKIQGKTRVDGVLEVGGKQIAIETVTSFYKQSQINKKREYCQEQGIEYNEYRI